MNQAARRLAQLGKGDSARRARARRASGRAQPPTAMWKRRRTPPRCRARLRELSAHGESRASMHVGAAFSAATDAARLRMPLGGDLIDPGVSAKRKRLTPRGRCIACHSAQGALRRQGAGRASARDRRATPSTHMLAAYVLDPQRPSFDPQALCESAGVALGRGLPRGLAVAPARSGRRKSWPRTS